MISFDIRGDGQSIQLTIPQLYGLLRTLIESYCNLGEMYSGLHTAGLCYFDNSYMTSLKLVRQQCQQIANIDIPKLNSLLGLLDRIANVDEGLVHAYSEHYQIKDLKLLKQAILEDRSHGVVDPPEKVVVLCAASLEINDKVKALRPQIIAEVENLIKSNLVN